MEKIVCLSKINKDYSKKNFKESKILRTIALSNYIHIFQLV